MSATQSRYAIGGSFELDSISLGPPEQLSVLVGERKGSWTVSGRAAFELLLRHLQSKGARHVHLPSYLCESVLLPIRALGMDMSFYPVDKHLNGYPDPPSDAVVVVIHYFGWENRCIDALRANAGQGYYLVEDLSHGLMSAWSSSADVSELVFFSARKLGPVSLGGWCSIEVELDRPSVEIEGLAWRSLAARLARAQYLSKLDAQVDPAIEAFYLEAFAAVEEHLDSHPLISALPQVVLDILSGLDWHDIAARRRSNWLQLHDLLSRHVELPIEELPADVVPLGYLVRLQDRDRIRKALAAQRFFCPVHWPLASEVSKKGFPDAGLLARSCLTLPIDQRYGPKDMMRMSSALRGELQRHAC